MTETTTQVERVALAIEGVIEENNDLMTDWYEGGGWKNIRELAGKSATAAIKAMSDAEPVASHEVDETGKPTDDSDPWFQLGWH